MHPQCRLYRKYCTKIYYMSSHLPLLLDVGETHSVLLAVLGDPKAVGVPASLIPSTPGLTSIFHFAVCRSSSSPISRFLSSWASSLALWSPRRLASRDAGLPRGAGVLGRLLSRDGSSSTCTLGRRGRVGLPREG